MKCEFSCDRYALERMLFETCGEDQDIVENAKVIMIAPHEYWIQYSNTEFDPYNEIDLKVKITTLPFNEKKLYHFHIYDSVYGDDGDFFLDYHLVADK